VAVRDGKIVVLQPGTPIGADAPTARKHTAVRDPPCHGDSGRYRPSAGDSPSSVSPPSSPGASSAQRRA
jgi:hypothetical protein